LDSNLNPASTHEENVLVKCTLEGHIGKGGDETSRKSDGGSELFPDVVMVSTPSQATPVIQVSQTNPVDPPGDLFVVRTNFLPLLPFSK
jgi:hypothetical protein